jgi:hypothetical protein
MTIFSLIITMIISFVIGFCFSSWSIAEIILEKDEAELLAIIRNLKK